MYTSPVSACKRYLNVPIPELMTMDVFPPPNVFSWPATDAISHILTAPLCVAQPKPPPSQHAILEGKGRLRNSANACCLESSYDVFLSILYVHFTMYITYFHDRRTHSPRSRSKQSHPTLYIPFTQLYTSLQILVHIP